MQRDWELVRKILFALENLELTSAHLDSRAIEGYDPDLISYHFYILKQAGLIEATCMKVMDAGLNCIATSITWEGHEFLDKVRSDTTWNKIKMTAKSIGVDLSFEAIKQVAVVFLKRLLDASA